KIVYAMPMTLNLRKLKEAQRLSFFVYKRFKIGLKKLFEKILTKRMGVHII
ncbi:MAG: hypothetical protein K0R69_1591, partial [Clostridia bacterium]|nr:hypothetical protein [Clostridia bacterium]